MKKLISVLLALVMCLSVTTFAWADGEMATVYVNTATGSDTAENVGTKDAPAKTLKKAMELVATEGTIIVTGETTVRFWGDQNTDKTIVGGHYYVTKSVTIEGDGMTDVNGIALPSDFGGKLTLRNITFDGTSAIGIYDGGLDSTAELVIDHCTFTKAGGNCVYIGTEIESLTVNDCTFTTPTGNTYSKQYLVWPSAAKNIIITDNRFYGNGNTRAAIHLGTGHSQGTTAKVTGNTIDGFERGVQLALSNNAENNVTITGNTFSKIARAANSTAEAEQYGVIFVHDSMKNTTTVTYGNNTLNESQQEIYTENTEVSVEGIFSVPEGSVLVKNNDGTYSVVAKQPAPTPEPPTPVEPEQPAHTNRRYPATTTTTETPAKGNDITSAKTFDGGVALYVGMALTSSLGMAWMGKKRAH